MLKWEKNYYNWLYNKKVLKIFKINELKKLKDNEIFECIDSFKKNLEFGTAGIRSKIGFGINRLNIFTVKRIIVGLVKFIIFNIKCKKNIIKSVVISYDTRQFSIIFVKEIIKILTFYKIKVYIFDDVRPTPELSFAIRQLKCCIGIMITASHNSFIYNGIKIYDNNGAQFSIKNSKILKKYIDFIDDPLKIKDFCCKKRYDFFLNKLNNNIDNLYLENLEKKIILNKKKFEYYKNFIKVIYTPLHGTGINLIYKILKKFQFKNIFLVKEQMIKDEKFSTVKLPNPELFSSFKFAIKLDKIKNADILIATDADADRIGVVIKENNKYILLNGNQLGIIILNYIINFKKKNKIKLNNFFIIKSIVTTELADKIAKFYNIKVINVLPGFKFIADEIEKYSKNKKMKFLFAFEESNGYLLNSFVRDKDSFQILILLIEIIINYKLKKINIINVLNGIYKKFGFFKEETISIFDNKKILNFLKKYYFNKKWIFLNQKVKFIEDFEKSIKFFPNGKFKKIKFLKEKVLKYYFENNSYFIIRKSGTENKTKIYLYAIANNKKNVEEKIKIIKNIIINYIIK